MVLRPKDDRDLPAKKKTFETNILNFVLERASISNFYGATNQNNSGKFVLHASRRLWITLENCSRLHPHTPRNFH